VQIGRIVGAHGIGGEIRIHPLTDFPERFFEMKALCAQLPGKPDMELEVLSVRPHEAKGQLLVSVAGITDRDAAEALKGRIITVDPQERVELPEGEYWIDSLIGLDVIDAESGEHLGKIEDVMSTGSNDVYQVRTGGGDVKLVPAVGDIVAEISLESGTMRINVMEGLWD
jgi:16S rRNA processing protein RimM